MSKLERLMNLTAALLQTERPLTAEELLHRVDGYSPEPAAARRSFERDKEDLREMGVPISLEPIHQSDPPADGYRIHKHDYYLDDPGLDPDELASLHLAASAVRIDGLSGSEALWKLGGTVGEPSREAELAALPSDPNLPVVFSALADHRTLTFRYNDAERTLEPHRLDFQRGRWYLTGHDRSREATRNFRLDRIDGTVVGGEPGSFTRPAAANPGARAQPWEFGDEPPVRAQLLIDTDQAPSTVHQLGTDAVVERRADGSVVVEVEVTNSDAFRSFVVGFLDHAEVLGPPEMRALVVDWLEEIAGS